MAATSIPLNDLSRGAGVLRAELEAAASRVIASGWYVLGPENDALAAELSDYVGIANVIPVGNGTDALQIALAAVGVSRDSRVVTVANAGGYTSVATRALGAIPVYADVAPETLLMSAQTLETALDTLATPPAAVVVTHLFGALAPVQDIVRMAHARGIPVIEDCAQSLGARMNGRLGGTFADAATVSFYPTKNLGALGDGGAVLTGDAQLAEHVRSLRQYGWSSKYHVDRLHGQNSRLDEMQAAFLRVKLAHLDAWNDRRREIHYRYEQSSVVGGRLVNVSGASYVGHLATLIADDRDGFRERMAAFGVATDIHYPIPDHRQKVETSASWSLPVTDWAAERVVSIPIFPELTEDEITRIVDALESR